MPAVSACGRTWSYCEWSVETAAQVSRAVWYLDHQCNCCLVCMDEGMLPAEDLSPDGISELCTEKQRCCCYFQGIWSTGED